MAMTGFICHDNYYDRLARLTDAEVGHLFRQLMLYHAGRTDEMTDFIGIEGLAFDFIASDIDRMEEKHTVTSETNRINGLKGGRPKKQPEPEETEENRPEPEKTEINRNKPTETEAKRTKAYKDKDKDKDKDKYFIDDDNARAIAEDQNRVLDAAEDAGFKMSNNVRAAMIELYAEHGLEKVLDGLQSCTDHGATTLAYLKAVLKGEPRAEPKKEKDFEQRDYSGEQDAAMERMIAWHREHGGYGHEPGAAGA